MLKGEVLIPEHTLVLVPHFDRVLIQSIPLCSIKMTDEICFLKKKSISVIDVNADNGGIVSISEGWICGL